MWALINMLKQLVSFLPGVLTGYPCTPFLVAILLCKKGETPLRNSPPFCQLMAAKKYTPACHATPTCYAVQTRHLHLAFFFFFFFEGLYFLRKLYLKNFIFEKLAYLFNTFPLNDSLRVASVV